MALVNYNGIRVLIVDDERTIASTLAAILKVSGYESLAAFSGEEAVDAAKDFRPDLLICDYKMPGINGLETAVAIKKLLPACRVFMLSGHLLESDYKPFRERGYNFTMLSKPIPPVALLEAISRDSGTFAPVARAPKVLNVDNVEMHRYSISRLLRQAGFEVSEAGTGADAFRQALEVNPDLILLDINLPDMTGFDVCKRLKEDERTSSITVVHLTASSTDQRSQALSSDVGADEFIRQPVDATELIRQIRSLLQEKYLREGLLGPDAATTGS